MISGYAFLPCMCPWLMVAAAATCGGLAVYAWRRRSVPSARALAVMALLGVPWAIGAALEGAAVDTPTRLLWFKFHALWELPAATAALWFALEYADLRRWITSPKLTLLAIPPILASLVILTSDAHHLVWETFSYDPALTSALVVVHAPILVYRGVVSLTTIVLFLWLFLKSPAHRPGAGLCLSGLLLTRAAHLVDALGGLQASRPDVTVLTFPLMCGLFAVALFRFHVFDLIPVARGTVVDQMHEGMLVLNASQQILDINPAAERMLDIAAAQARGRTLSEALPRCPGLAPPDGAMLRDSEICCLPGGTGTAYSVRHSPLVHPRGSSLGWLILFHDVTGERDAQAKLLAQERALATLQERDRVGRELHDSLGQVLGYVKMQAQASRELLTQGRLAAADAGLARLVRAVQDSHSDVRDYILAARTGVADEGAFVETLQNLLRRYSETHGIPTTLDVARGLREKPFEPMVAAQLLRIIQEALSNVRKHARAHGVSVRLSVSPNCCAQAIVEDDGEGFDPALLTSRAATFGLRIMQERAQEIGASLHVRSAPGKGAQVVVTLPPRREAHEGPAGRRSSAVHRWTA